MSPATAAAVGWKNSLNQLSGSVGTVGLESDITNPIGLLIQAVLALSGMIFLVLTVYAGFLWMTASGNESKVEKAQKIITAAVIGLVIVSSAYAITYYVTKSLGGTAGGPKPGTNDGTCPGTCIGVDDSCSGTIIYGFTSCDRCCVRQEDSDLILSNEGDKFLAD